MVYYSLEYSHLQYCINSWGSASETTLHPLKIIQKRSIRIITGSKYGAHAEPLFHQLQCFKLNDIDELEMAKLMYKINNNMISPTKANDFQLISQCHDHRTRLRNNRNYCLPRVRTTLGQNIRGGSPRGHILKSLALASKPQVLGIGLGLEALGPRKLPCPWLEDRTIF